MHHLARLTYGCLALLLTLPCQQESGASLANRVSDECGDPIMVSQLYFSLKGRAVKVIDGACFIMQLDGGRKKEVHLIGLEAPHPDERGGRRVAAASIRSDFGSERHDLFFIVLSGKEQDRDRIGWNLKFPRHVRRQHGATPSRVGALEGAGTRTRLVGNMPLQARGKRGSTSSPRVVARRPVGDKLTGYFFYRKSAGILM